MIVSETKSIYVGGAVVSALVLIFVLLSGGDELTGDGVDGSYRMQAAFNRVDGLVIGDEVRLGGVRIGTVSGQKLDNNYRAIVEMKIDKGVALPTDTSAAIHTDGLFGSKYVVMEPGGEEEYFTDGDVINFTQDALIVSELLEMIIAQGKTRIREMAEKAKQGEQ